MELSRESFIVVSLVFFSFFENLTRTVEIVEYSQGVCYVSWPLGDTVATLFARESTGRHERASSVGDLTQDFETESFS